MAVKTGEVATITLQVVASIVLIARLPVALDDMYAVSPAIAKYGKSLTGGSLYFFTASTIIIAAVAKTSRSATIESAV